MGRVLVVAFLLCVLGAGAAGCGSSGKHATTTPAVTRSALPSLKSCFERRGYNVDVESPQVRGTAPKEFEFVAVWNLVNPSKRRIALAITMSRTRAGAARAAAWLRKTNKRITKGVVRAPVVQFDKLNVLWTTDPDTRDTRDIYGCVRQSL